ncbi:hypothetical protein Tco_0713751 [Tanacetum coccineum]
MNLMDEFDEVEGLIGASGWGSRYVLFASVYLCLGYKGFGMSSYELFKMQHGHTIKVTEMEVDVNKDEIMRWKLVKLRPKKKVKIQILKPGDMGINDVNKDDTDVIGNPRSMIKEETESRLELVPPGKKDSYHRLC